MSELKVPELGESILEATVGTWLKHEGDPVQAGEAVVELETEKVNLEVISDFSGTLQRILRQSGDTVTVGETLAVIADGDDATDGVSSAGTTSASPQADPTPPPKAAPSVRRTAAAHGVDLQDIKGSGSGGRILKKDVLAQSGRGTAVQPAPPPPAATSATSAETVALPADSMRREERVRMSRRRLTIARRLVEAQHTAAMLTTFNEVDMSHILDIRRRRKDAFKDKYGVSLGFMSFFTKAVVGALKEFPRLNAEISGEEMVLKHYYDIGIAVATDAGLVVPVVRDADRLSFAEIEQRIADLAAKARQNELTLQDLQGGTFTITNGGVFGSLLSTPILNAPQVGILGMHKIQERPIAVNGSIEVRPMMYVALSYDHRIVDGSEAVRFLVKVKELLEDPETLLLEG